MATQGEFDFIVVGAGSAGAVLAERLSADPRHRVLLVEEGCSDGGWIGRIPKGYGKLVNDAATAHYYPVGHSDPRWPGGVWVRGKMLGGSSGLNGMVWNRGGAEDYDALEARGNPGWGWADMLPHLRALENHALGASELRGTGGPIGITSAVPNRLGDAFMAAGVQDGLAVKEDQNGPVLEGVGYAQWNIDRAGRRVSSAHGFLAKARGRANLRMETGIRVDRVLVEQDRATGIAGVRDGQPVEFRCRGEVILSAGTIASPRILQLSGIGDGAVLAQAGVAVSRHSPHVGRRLREHQTLGLNFRLRHWRDSFNRQFGGARLFANVLRHALTGGGPLRNGAAQAIAFVRANPQAPRADTQIMFLPWSFAVSAKGIGFETEPGMQCFSYMLRPDSEGSALIASADPAEPLRIDSNHLATEHDRATCVAGTRAVRRLMGQPALAPYVVGETGETAAATADEDILDLYRTTGRCGYHAVGTIAMGPDEDDAIDSRLRVRGIEGLRVVDGSIFREIPSGNTNAPIMAAGLRAAELILAG